VLTSASFIKINSRKALDSPPLEKPTHGAALCLPKITPQEFVPCILAGPACNSFSGNEDNQQIKFACKVLSVYLLVLQTRSDDPSENECRNNIDIPLAGFVMTDHQLIFAGRVGKERLQFLGCTKSYLKKPLMWYSGLEDTATGAPQLTILTKLFGFTRE